MTTFKDRTIADSYDTIVKRTETYAQAGTRIMLMTDTNATEVNTGLYLEGGGGENVGIGVADPDTKLEVFYAGTQLKLSYDATDFCTFAVDTNHDITITPSSTGQIKLKPTTDSVDFFQVLDADAGTPILNVDATNERVGIGTASPGEALEIKNGDLWLNNADTATTGSWSNTRPGITISTHTTDVNGYGGALYFASTDDDLSSTPRRVAAISWQASQNYTGSDDSGSRLCFFTQADNQTDAATVQRMMIDEDGWVGIGVTATLGKVHIRGGSTSAGVYTLLIQDSGNTGTFACEDDGSVRLPRLTSNGTIETSAGDGTLVLTSDKRLKENFETISDGLITINKLNPTYYTWKEHDLDGNPQKIYKNAITGVEGQRECGFLAQEVGDVIPEASDPNLPDEVIRGIRDRSLIAFAVKAIQELSAKVTALENA